MNAESIASNAPSLLREVQAAEEGLEAGLGASPLSVSVGGYSLVDFVEPVEDEVEVGDFDDFLRAFELSDQETAASGRWTLIGFLGWGVPS